MRSLRSLAPAAALAAAAFASPASAAPTAAALTCDWTVPAFGSGDGVCSLTGVANGTVYALEQVDVDLYSVVGSLCMATGTAQGHFGAPLNTSFELTWAGPAAVLTFSGETTGAGAGAMVLVAGNPCFSPEMSYTLVLELTGV